MIFGYSRVSKGEDQNPKLQLDAFEKLKVDKVFEEIASGGRWERPMLHDMLGQLRVKRSVLRKNFEHKPLVTNGFSDL